MTNAAAAAPRLSISIHPCFLCDGDAALRQFGESIHVATPFEMNAAFAPELRRQMEFYNHNPSSDKMSAVGKAQRGADHRWLHPRA
jgi:hypothetical protein